jgi:phage shock protein PspC (stress-responsive transcriptional regulator)
MEQNPSGFDRNQLHNVQSWRRSRSDRMVAGVCGGMARALNVDPVLVRVVMAVLVLSGPGILFYAAGWILMPDEGSDKAPVEGLLGNRVPTNHPWLWPVVLGICVFLAIVVMSSFDSGKLIPGPLVVLGLLWLFVFRRKPKNGSSHWSHPGMGLHGRPQDTPPQQPGPTPYGTAQYGQTTPQTSQYVGQQAPQNGPPPPPAGPSSPWACTSTSRPPPRPRRGSPNRRSRACAG